MKTLLSTKINLVKLYISLIIKLKKTLKQNPL